MNIWTPSEISFAEKWTVLIQWMWLIWSKSVSKFWNSSLSVCALSDSQYRTGPPLLLDQQLNCPQSSLCSTLLNRFCILWISASPILHVRSFFFAANEKIWQNCQDYTQCWRRANVAAQPSPLRHLSDQVPRHLADVQEGRSVFLDRRGSGLVQRSGTLGDSEGRWETLHLAHSGFLRSQWWNCQWELGMLN